MTINRSAHSPDVVSLLDARIDRLARNLRGKLSSYLTRPEIADEVEDGLIQFFPDLPYDEGELDPEATEAALDWVTFAYRAREDGATLCEHYLAHGDDLTPQEREGLAAWANSAPGFFRVEAVVGGKVQLLRLPDERRFTVRSPRSRLTAGRLITAWLLPTLSAHCFGFTVDEFSPELIDPLTHLLGVELELLQRQRPGASWDDLYRSSWPRLMQDLFLAMEEQLDPYRIKLPPGPSVRWNGAPVPEAPPWWEEVARLIRLWFEEPASPEEANLVEGAIRLWWDGALALSPKAARPEGWAAGVIYLYHQRILGDEGLIQADVAGGFDVSVSTVGNRSRQLAAALQVEPLDTRYIDLMSPRVRLFWRMYCLMLSGQVGEELL